MAKKDVYDIIDQKFDKHIKREQLIVDAERFKTYDEVFDQQNLDNIYRLMKRKKIKTVECPISTGKEANVYLAKTFGKDAAVKIFRTSTSTFGAFLEYMEGDRRFQRIDRSHRGVIYTWARKEFMNLETMHEEGIRVPQTQALFRNILVMDYIGYEGKPAPQLKVLDADHDEWEEMWKIVLDTVEKLFLDCELVHADLSEYNILYDGAPMLIDVGQSLDLSHPRSLEMLDRDLRIISTFFERKGIDNARKDALSLKDELVATLEEDEQ
ncbi:MAG: serine protein kinase RIO [Candidatus Thermoplasmatota archaeon]|nr:serine protein kinase RIO [Candidatus Thermoplasmatota archaeon]